MVCFLVRSARLMKACLRCGRSDEEAKDLIRETFVRRTEHLHSAEDKDGAVFLATTTPRLANNQYHYKSPVCNARQAPRTWTQRLTNRFQFCSCIKIKTQTYVEQWIAGRTNVCPA
jgi:hypothetical protein